MAGAVLLLLATLALAVGGALGIFVQSYGLPQQCQTARNPGEIKWPTVSQYCTSGNLGLAQPLDACNDLTGCIAWAMTPQFGNISTYAEATKTCRAYCSIQQSAALYSNCIDPCTGASLNTGCAICNTIDASLYRRLAPVYQPEYKREARGKPKPTTKSPSTTKPTATTPAPTTPAPTPAPICAVPNAAGGWPASADMGECQFYQQNSYEPLATFGPRFCGTPEWSTFAMPELTVLIDSNTNYAFADYHNSWGLVDMSGAEIFSRALALGKRIFKVQECANGNSANVNGILCDVCASL